MAICTKYAKSLLIEQQDTEYKYLLQVLNKDGICIAETESNTLTNIIKNALEHGFPLCAELEMKTEVRKLTTE